MSSAFESLSWDEQCFIYHYLNDNVSYTDIFSVNLEEIIKLIKEYENEENS